MNYDPSIKKIRIIDTNGECLCAKYVNHKKFIAGGFLDGSTLLYDSRNHNLEMTLTDRDTKNINNATTYIAIDKKNPNLLTVAYSGGFIKIWNISDSSCLSTIREKRQTYGVVYHPNISKYFTYGDDGKIHLYDEVTNKHEFTYQKSEKSTLDGHSSKIFAMIFNPTNSNEFLTGGWDNTLYFWDVRSQCAIRYLSDIFIGGEGIAINNRGTEFITGEWKRDDPLKLWDYKTTQLIDVVRPDLDTSQIYSCRYLNNYNIAVAGTDQNIFRVVNMQTQTTISYIKNLDHGVYTVDFPKLKKEKSTIFTFDDTSSLPSILLSSGKSIYEIKY